MIWNIVKVHDFCDFDFCRKLVFGRSYKARYFRLGWIGGKVGRSGWHEAQGMRIHSFFDDTRHLALGSQQHQILINFHLIVGYEIRVRDVRVEFR